jgi:Di-sulfide bridge nucleocytoplasmic transport domain
MNQPHKHKHCTSSSTNFCLSLLPPPSFHSASFPNFPLLLAFMAYRSNAGPMDFSWDNRTGPVDNQSPFLTAVQKATQSNDPSQQHNSKRKTVCHPHIQNNALIDTGPRSEFESPTRSLSSFPSLRPAAGQTTLFSNLPRSSSPEKPLPAAPNLDIFRTPRKLEPDFFSSGGETPETPNNDADSEATPNLLPRMSPKKMGSQSVVAEEKRASPKKKRESFMDRMWSPSRRNLLKPYSRKAEQRVVKRRAHQKSKSSKSHGTESESESESRAKKESKAKPGFVQGTLAPWLKVVEDHPNAPSILITYLQLFTNMTLIFFSMYVVWSLWSGILGDVDKGVHETKSEALIEIMHCKQDWIHMNCEKPARSAIELCDQLAKCISKDPEKIARAQVSAKTFAKIINDFAEPISLKAMIFYLSIFAIFWYSTNATWNGLRNKLSAEQFMSHHQMPPPPTPHRHPSNGIYPPNTPYSIHYQTPGGYLHSAMEPGPSAVVGEEHQRRLEFG